MSIGIDKEILIREFVKAIENKNAAIFAGAGLSKSAGFVDWKGLLRPVADEIKLDVEKECDLVAVAQYCINNRCGNRGFINQMLIEEFTKKVSVTENHKILSKLPIDTYWTTNYDKLIEKVLEENGKTVDVKITQDNLATNKPKRDAIIYKMHGDVDQIADAVICKDDYDSYNLKRQLFTTTLQGDLVSKTFLFVGISFDDPNIDYILSRIKILLGQNKREHYCIFRKVNENDNIYANDRDKFIYDQTKQDLRVKDLQRYSINVVLVDKYAEITGILEQVERLYRKKIVFISGSANNYGSWGEDKALGFVKDLSFKLVAEGNKLVSGYGLGIGSAVITGALECIFSSRYRHLDEHIMLYPFPQTSRTISPEQRKELFSKYRHEMISNAGVAIFVFGNKKLEDGSEVIADGVLKEFDIAIEHGLNVMPIGATGFAAEELWKKVNDNFGEFYGDNDKIKPLFQKLGNKDATIEELIESVIKILHILQQSNVKGV
ncbi:MAG: SIR2 family protein [Magnetococcales bacterium]|nr:SIR2 family protein [Nitrospirota bacterium]